MSSSRNCGCYGTLNYVHGPLSCGYPPADPQDYLNFPFYNGPCPSVCQSNSTHCFCCDGGATSSACSGTLQPLSVFTASAPIALDAGSKIVLQPSVVNQALFVVTDGGILIRKSGTYLAIYTVTLPAGQSVNTSLSLSLNENPIAASQRDLVSAKETTSTVSLTSSSILQAEPDSLLSMCTEGSIEIMKKTENLITLTLLRASCGCAQKRRT